MNLVHYVPSTGSLCSHAPTGAKYLSFIGKNIVLERGFQAFLLLSFSLSPSPLFILFPIQAVEMDLLAWVRDRLLNQKPKLLLPICSGF